MVESAGDAATPPAEQFQPVSRSERNAAERPPQPPPLRGLRREPAEALADTEAGYPATPGTQTLTDASDARPHRRQPPRSQATAEPAPTV